MSIDPYARVRALGLVLPVASPPKGTYVPAVRSGRHVYVSGQVPMIDGELAAVGTVGTDITPADAAALSAMCALAALAAIEMAAGLRTVERVVKVVGFVACQQGFAGVDAVIDGASDLLIAVFGEAGRHARTAVGVGQLPLGSPVEVEILVQVSG